MGDEFHEIPTCSHLFMLLFILVPNVLGNFDLQKLTIQKTRDSGSRKIEFALKGATFLHARKVYPWALHVEKILYFGTSDSW